MGISRGKLAGGFLLALFAAAALLHGLVFDRAGRFLVLPATAPAELRGDLIVVLDGLPSRHREGVRLLDEGVAPRILFTMRRPSPERYGRYGVPEGRWVVPVQASDNTFEEARAVRETIRGGAVRTVVLVTSDYHTRRAARIFRKVLGAGVALRVHPVESGHLGGGRKWWLYGSSRRVIVGEYLKLAYYWFRYPGRGEPGKPWRIEEWLKSLYGSVMVLLGSKDDVPPARGQGTGTGEVNP